MTYASFAKVSVIKLLASGRACFAHRSNTFTCVAQLQCFVPGGVWGGGAAGCRAPCARGACVFVCLFDMHSSRCVTIFQAVRLHNTAG